MKPTALLGPLTVAALLLSVVASAANQSQQTGGAAKWWQSDHYKRELNLTADQSRDLEAIFQAAVPKQKELKKSLDEAEALLEQYVSAQDKRAAEEQVTRVVNARAELHKSHARMLLEMAWVLTPQQYAKLGELQSEMQKGGLQKGEKPRDVDKSK